MSQHPLNLALRFLLELTALGAIGLYGWQMDYGPWRIPITIGLPFIMAVAWGAFAVPDDSSRSGNSPIPTPGILRLILELVIFGFATWALYWMEFSWWSLALGSLVTVHYLLSYDRVAWLLGLR